MSLIALWAWVAAHASLLLLALYAASTLCLAALALRMYDLYRRQELIARHHGTTISNLLKHARALDERLTSLSSLADRAVPHDPVIERVEGDCISQPGIGRPEPSAPDSAQLESIREEIERLLADLQQPDDIYRLTEQREEGPDRLSAEGGAAAPGRADTS